MIKVNRLSDLFGVSGETIRRDLEYLEEAGRLSRVYGGAIAKTMYGMEPEFSKREVKSHAEKKAIGRLAVNLVEDGETVVIDGGATTLEFARQLVGRKKLTVITNSMLIAMTLSGQAGFRTILLGGDVKTGDFSTSGFLSEDNMRMFNVDKCITGICGLTIERGVTDYHIEESSLRRNMIAQAPFVIALADYTKLGVTCLNRVCDAKSVHVLVTDSKADKEIVTKLREMGVEVLQATPHDEDAQPPPEPHAGP